MSSWYKLYAVATMCWFSLYAGDVGAAYAPVVGKSGSAATAGGGGLHGVVAYLTANTAAYIATLNVAYLVIITVFVGISRCVLGRVRDIEATGVRKHMIRYAFFRTVFVLVILDVDRAELTAWTTWYVLIACMRVLVLLAHERVNSDGGNDAAADKRLILFAAAMTTLNVVVVGGVVALFHAAPSALALLVFENALLACGCARLLAPHIVMWWYAGRRRRHRRPLAVADNGDAPAADDAPVPSATAASSSSSSSSSPPPHWTHERDAVEYYTTFVAEVCGHVMTLAHLWHVWLIAGLAVSFVDVFLFMNVRTQFVSLSKRVAALHVFQRTLTGIATHFADASAAELARARDDVCAICRDTMTSAKLLPCGHLLHRVCLQQWVRHKPQCPVCKRSLAVAGAAASPAPVPPRPALPATADEFAAARSAARQRLAMRVQRRQLGAADPLMPTMAHAMAAAGPPRPVPLPAAAVL